MQTAAERKVLNWSLLPWVAYLPDGNLLRRSGRMWVHVEALPLHTGIADACDYDKCS